MASSLTKNSRNFKISNFLKNHYIKKSRRKRTLFTTSTSTEEEELSLPDKLQILPSKTIKSIIETTPINDEVDVYGWIRSIRVHSKISFAVINDGSCLNGIQVTFPPESAKKLTTGSCVRFRGKLVKSPGEEQSVELKAKETEILGECDSGHTMQFLREISHLRSRSSLFGSVIRIRNGQLHAEMIACAMSRVFTFGPVFRAEWSFTSKHLAEFWMLEAEIAYLFKLEDLLDFIEGCLREVTRYVLDNYNEDLEFCNKWYDRNLLLKLESLTERNSFVRMTYTEAIKALQQSKMKFFYQPEWGKPLHREHEIYLSNNYCQRPVFVTNYPKNVKPFYMRLNPDGKTVACTDLLMPDVGELLGGSLREERYGQLEDRMDEMKLDKEQYKWYLDLRKYGSVPHGGFGIGFDRYLQYITSLDDIHDVIPFPRSANYCKC
nr:8259_t:CDS:2 [Entrophospora candida]